jgi:hypothetical protein
MTASPAESSKRPAWWPTAEQKLHADAGCAHPDECKLTGLPARHTFDGRVLRDVDYIHCMHGHESCYEWGAVPTLNGQQPDTLDADGPSWRCPHADGPDAECDDTLCLLPAPSVRVSA